MIAAILAASVSAITTIQYVQQTGEAWFQDRFEESIGPYVPRLVTVENNSLQNRVDILEARISSDELRIGQFEIQIGEFEALARSSPTQQAFASEHIARLRNQIRNLQTRIDIDKQALINARLRQDATEAP